MRKFFESNCGKLLVGFIEFLILLGLIIGILLTLEKVGLAEGEQSVWVLCDPDSYVCIREAPRKSAFAVGGATCGTRLETDGKAKGSYIHLVNVPAEDCEGWISAQFIVYDEPYPMDRTATVVSNGKLAVRKGINGKVKKWLKPMEDSVRIRWWSDEWCLTTAGYVQTEFLELDGEY